MIIKRFKSYLKELEDEIERSKTGWEGLYRYDYSNG